MSAVNSFVSVSGPCSCKCRSRAQHCVKVGALECSPYFGGQSDKSSGRVFQPREVAVSSRKEGLDLLSIVFL